MKYLVLLVFMLMGFKAFAGQLNCKADNGSWTEIGFDEDGQIEYTLMQLGLADIEIIRNAKIDILNVTPENHVLKVDFFILEDATGEIVLIVDGDAYLDRTGIYKVTICEYVE